MTGEQEITKKIVDLVQQTATISQQQLVLAQRASSESDISQDLVKLLGERDRLLNELEKLLVMLPGQRDFPGLKPGQPDGQKIYELATIIDKNDQQTRALLEKHLAGVGSKLKTLRQSKRAVKAYAPNGEPNPWFFDGKR